MKSARICLLSLACASGALAFGLAANAAIDLVLPLPDSAPVVAASVPAVRPAEAAQASVVPQPVAYALASTTSSPTEISPIKVKTIPMLYREEAEAPAVTERAVAPVVEHSVAPITAAVPLPRPRPASAPVMAMASAGPSLSLQPGSLAISAATRKGAPDDGYLGTAGIERMKTALALTAEQEEYWPAIASELLALGKAMKANAKTSSGKANVDNEQIQRLYWAAAPLLTRLSYEQKSKVKQMAHLMGLNQVADAL
jgi:hypothetical protein